MKENNLPYIFILPPLSGNFSLAKINIDVGVESIVLGWEDGNFWRF